ncbi:MAG: YlxR family protein [Ardenticatenales bacterium]
MAPKHEPERMCALCRARAPKRELQRVVWDGAAVVLDTSGKAQGRGAYVGRTRSCWSDPGLVPKLQRALKAVFSADDAARLRAIAADTIDDGQACPRRAALTQRSDHTRVNRRVTRGER